MDRKDFIKTFGNLCAGAGILGCGCERALALSQDATKETPLSEKFEWAQTWVKRLFDILDRELDSATRTRIMEEMGRTCYEGSIQGLTIKPRSIDELMAWLNKQNGEDSIRRDGNVLFFQFTRNPAGLRVTDGYCLCPLVEKGPEGLSGTYCQCSVGYVRNMFSMYLEKPVQVELLESLKRGGKTCRFKVMFA
jgi:hypothetical protein